MNTPFIVAEVSGNHLGSLDRALRLIDAAKAAGADAVKFQAWSEMSVDSRQLTAGPWAGRSLPSLYAETRTPWPWFEFLFRYCRNVAGIECFSSVFDRAALDFLEEQHNCPRYKIASFEITDLPLIKAVAATGKPMIISTGMASFFEINEAQATAISHGCRDLTLLKCTSSYPAPLDACNLATIPVMRHTFDQNHLGVNGCNVGLSDHTLGIAAAVAATALGATVIEKHLTLKRSDGGPDAAFSAEPDEFSAMVKACREVHQAIGHVHYGPTEAERSSLQYRRSLWVVSDVKAGETFTAQNVRSLRPADGLPPAEIDNVIGRRAARDVSRESPLTRGDIA